MHKKQLPTNSQNIQNALLDFRSRDLSIFEDVSF